MHHHEIAYYRSMQDYLLGQSCPPNKQCGLMSAEAMGDISLRGMMRYGQKAKYFVDAYIVRYFIKVCSCCFFQRLIRN